MASLEWIPALSVGDRELDDEHKVLFALINRLEVARDGGGDPAVSAEILRELGVYTHKHFSHEERLFAEGGYTEAEPHSAEHLFFATRIGDFQSDLAAGKAEVDGAILDFLKTWLTRHIAMTDRKYRPWLTGRTKA